MKNPVFKGFPAELFDFLAELAANNNRAWFQANKSRYQDDQQTIHEKQRNPDALKQRK